MSSEKYLAGKTAIVTGSSKLNGIGAATALTLAKHGANVRTCSVFALNSILTACRSLFTMPLALNPPRRSLLRSRHSAFKPSPPKQMHHLRLSARTSFAQL
jgi:hypothetical protein